MSILLDEKNKIIVQGITGHSGSFHTKSMVSYGSNVVAGVTPLKGGDKLDSIPVYNTIYEAKKYTDANTSIIFVPPSFSYDAILEAIENEIELIVCITEGIPVIDMLKIKKIIYQTKTVLIGPNCPGIISPGKSKLGIMPSEIHKKGNVGVVSRSGTLTYEAVFQLSNLGIGQSTCIGIGGDPVLGFTFLDAVKKFNEDNETNLVVLIGEIGGNMEEEASEYINKYMSKPVVGYIAGKSAPVGKKMGHAGAIMDKKSGSADSKIDFLKKNNVIICNNCFEIGKVVNEIVLGK